MNFAYGSPTVVALHGKFSRGDLTGGQFLSELARAGFDCSPTLARTVRQHTEVRLPEVLRGLQKQAPTIHAAVGAQATELSAWQSQNVRAFLRDGEVFDQKLHNPGQSTFMQQPVSAYQWREQDSRNAADVIQGNRRDSYAGRVRDGPEAKVIATMLRLAKGRDAVDETISMLGSATGTRGMPIDALFRELKKIGVVMERAELEVLKRSFMARGPRPSAVDAHAIAVALADAAKNESGGKRNNRGAWRGGTSSGDGYGYGNNTTATTINNNSIMNGIDMSTRQNEYSRHRSTTTASQVSDDATSIVSTATFGTANVIPGFNTNKGKSYDQVRDEHIYARILSIMVVGGTPAKLRLMRTRLREQANVSGLQQGATYHADVVGSLDYTHFQRALRPIVPTIPEADYLAIFDNLHPDEYDQIGCSSFYHRLRGTMSDSRVASIDAVFRGLLEAEGKSSSFSSSSASASNADADADINDDTEFVELNTILSSYNPTKDPSVIQNKADVQDKIAELLECHQFVLPGTQRVTRKAWFDFCGDVSAAVVDDGLFHELMHGPWEAVVRRTHLRNGLPSNIRPLGFREAGREVRHVTSDGPLKLLRLMKRIISDSSWSDVARRQLFDQFDGDGDGFISPTELCIYFGRLNVRIPTDHMTELLKVIDADGDGLIGFQDFSSIVHASERNMALQNRGRMVKSMQGQHAGRPTIKVDDLNSIKEPLTVLRNRLLTHGRFPFQGFGDVLLAHHKVMGSVSPWVTKMQMESVFAKAGVPLDSMDVFRIFTVFQSQNAYQNTVHFWQFMNALVPRFSDRRKRVTQRVFKKLDWNTTGTIIFTDLAKRFYAGNHPSVKNGSCDPIGLSMAIESMLTAASSGKEKIDRKTWQHMIKHTLSAGCEDDAEFEEMMTHVWMAY
jgi:Ca2+-binding EF-hand superfamily protein